MNHRCKLLIVLTGLMIVAMQSAALRAEEEDKLRLPRWTQESTPAEIMQVVRESWRLPVGEAEDAKKQEILEYIIYGSEKVYQNEAAATELAVEAIQSKMQALGILSKSGNENAGKAALAMAEALKDDPREAVAREGKLILMSAQLSDLQKLDADARQNYVDQLVALLDRPEITAREAQIAWVTAQLLEKMQAFSAAVSLYKQTEAILQQASEEKTKELAARFEAAAKNLQTEKATAP